MKYVSLDIETTCLNPKDSKNVLGISMVVEDTSRDVPVKKLPNFTCIIDQGRFEGEPVALAMNAWIFEEIAKNRKRRDSKYPVLNPGSGVDVFHHHSGFLDADGWELEAHKFLDIYFGYEKIIVAGKNVAGFDMQFLPKSLQSRFMHRVIDVGSVFIDWKQDKYVIPSLDDLKKKYNMGEVTHDMYDDACDVIEILRKSYPKKITPSPLTEEEKVPLD